MKISSRHICDKKMLPMGHLPLQSTRPIYKSHVCFELGGVKKIHLTFKHPRSEWKVHSSIMHDHFCQVNIFFIYLILHHIMFWITLYYTWQLLRVPVMCFFLQICFQLNFVISLLFSLGLGRSKVLVLRYGPKMNTNVAVNTTTNYPPPTTNTVNFLTR